MQMAANRGFLVFGARHTARCFAWVIIVKKQNKRVGGAQCVEGGRVSFVSDKLSKKIFQKSLDGPKTKEYMKDINGDIKSVHEEEIRFVFV